MSLSFESEIVFPDHPYEAAFVYFAAMAYPDRGAGMEGQAGSEFATALAKFSIWSCSKARGLRYLREQYGDPSAVAPKKREFRGVFERGMRRIERRIAAYDLIGTQMLQGFFEVMRLGAEAVRAGKPEDAYHIHPGGGPSPARAELWQKGTPSIRRIIARAPTHWARKLSLNQTGAPADVSQKVKDDYERAFLPSIPVLHMVHGLTEAARRVGPSINHWEERNSLTAMLLNASLWIDKAIEQAEVWRQVSHHFPGMAPLSPDRMIRLRRAETPAIPPRYRATIQVCRQD